MLAEKMKKVFKKTPACPACRQAGGRTGRPAWLNKKIHLNACNQMKELLADLHLNTVCEEAKCPNISECFLKKEATFMILGDICTRNCSFCGIKKGMPDRVDHEEPVRVAEAVRRLGIKHAVITSVTRDDLSLGGAEFFSESIREIKKINEKITVEVLIPDFKLNLKAVKTVVEADPQIIAHNIETVPRLYEKVRSLSNYQASLEVLSSVKELNSHKHTKSGLMLGLGEKEEEVLESFKDLVGAGCDFLSIGQYLNPSSKHYPVVEYVEPEKFLYFKQQALIAGLKYVISGPYVRSSYCAGEYLESQGKK
jgi:lipoyl synthase